MSTILLVIYNLSREYEIAQLKTPKIGNRFQAFIQAFSSTLLFDTAVMHMI